MQSLKQLAVYSPVYGELAVSASQVSNVEHTLVANPCLPLAQVEQNSYQSSRQMGIHSNHKTQNPNQETGSVGWGLEMKDVAIPEWCLEPGTISVFSHQA